MKTYLYTMMVLLFVSVVNAQTGGFGTSCPTLAEQQAQYNQNLANGVRVVDTRTQQLQCYYQQLATYWQQKNKDDQQKAKDIQQLAKDRQQIEKEAQLIAWEKGLKDRELILIGVNTEIANFKLLIEQLKLMIGEGCCDHDVAERVKDHLNHSGQHDGTNPGGTTNDNGGVLNPSN